MSRSDQANADREEQRKQFGRTVLRKIRVAHGLRIREVAHALGIDESRISRYENHGEIPSDQYALLAYSQILELDKVQTNHWYNLAYGHGLVQDRPHLDLQQFGQDVLLKARKEAGLKQEVLARRVDVSTSTISRLENGRFGTRDLTLIQRISDELGLTETDKERWAYTVFGPKEETPRLAFRRLSDTVLGDIDHRLAKVRELRINGSPRTALHYGRQLERELLEMIHTIDRIGPCQFHRSGRH